MATPTAQRRPLFWPTPPHAYSVLAWATAALGALAALVVLFGTGPYAAWVATPCAPSELCLPPRLFVTEAAALARNGIAPDAYVAVVVLIQLATNGGYLVVAGLLLWYRRDHPMAICTAAVMVLLVLAMSGLLPVLLDPGGPAGWLIFATMWAAKSAVILFLSIFPSGHFAPRMLRWYAPLLVALNGAVAVAWAWAGLDSFSPAVRLANESLWMGSLLLAQLYRYARVSTPAERRQTRWLLGVLAACITLKLALGWLTDATHGRGDTWVVAVRLTALAVLQLLTLALMLGGVTMLRRGLFDLDRLVRRTLVWALLTACILALYVLLVGGLSLLLRPASNALVALVATGVIALAVQPLRAALQRGVNRLLYGRRDDPREVIAALGRQLEGALAADVVLPTVVRSLARELKLPYAAIVLDDRDEPAAASVGTPAEPLLVLPLSEGGVVIGRLFVAARASDEPFTPDERRLLEDLARQAGVAVRAARLNHELQRSRERLVAAREEERRRLQRDLHDELGPTLASMSMQLDAALASLADDPAIGAALLAEVRSQLKGTVGTVRQIVHQLRPPLLDQLGLAGAVRECALRVERSGSLAVRVELPVTLPPLSAAVEAAAYYIVAEALSNATRHASARSCTVRLIPGAVLLIEVADDGTGIPAQPRAGVGLRSMRERAEELGGTWEIAAEAGGGTLVRARLPLVPGS